MTAFLCIMNRDFQLLLQKGSLIDKKPIKINSMKNLLISVVLLALILSIGACSPKPQPEKNGLPALKVSENHRYLVMKKVIRFSGWAIPDGCFSLS